ncbi:MAG: response regulator [Planctomycetota bacterium]|nr:response regulator [Planctomycetota bacterium]MDP7133898.1 response regulator [Planctomycetota bacterium]MDP7249380.1 response regulator [Planctomycetota bacterium]
MEDNPKVLKLHIELLRSMGHQDVAIVSRADEAVELLQAGARPSLIISDLDLPDGSGLDVVREARVRANPLKSIICSGTLRCDLLIEARSMGAETVLRKPFTFTDFREVVTPYL